MYKKASLKFILVAPTIVLLLLTALYLYDPMQIFHKSYFTKELHLHGNMRQQAAGIINNFEFDSIILGTSMLENTSSIEASKKLGGNFVNISLSGSNFSERSYPLRHALASKKTKLVIYSLDSVYISQPIERSDFPLSSFDYLYTENKTHSFKAYLNDKFIACLVSLSSHPRCIGRKSNLDRPNSWHTNKDHSSRFGGLENWFKAKNNSQIKSAFASIVSISDKIKNGKVIQLPSDLDTQKENAEKYIKTFVIDYIAKYKNTQFILVFPPYSRIRYAQWAQHDLPSWEIHKHVVNFLAQESENHANLEIYGYEDQNFLDDIANYKDTGHYHHSINSKMLDDFQTKRHLLTSENIDNYLAQAEARATSYDMSIIADEIKAFLQQNP